MQFICWIQSNTDLVRYVLDKNFWLNEFHLIYFEFQAHIPSLLLLLVDCFLCFSAWFIFDLKSSFLPISATSFTIFMCRCVLFGFDKILPHQFGCYFFNAFSVDTHRERIIHVFDRFFFVIYSVRTMHVRISNLNLLNAFKVSNDVNITLFIILQ